MVGDLKGFIFSIILLTACSTNQPVTAPTIQSYNVSDIGWGMKQLEVDGVVARFVDLNLFLPALDLRCKNLTHLIIETSKGINLNLLDNLSSSLKSLKLSVNPSTCDLKMIEKFKNLQRLSISNVSSISDIVENSDLTILSGVFKLSKLEVLTLEGFKALRLIAIGARSGKLGHLRQLALRRMMDYNLQYVRTVAARLPRLQYFEIDDTYDLVNEIEEIFISLSPLFENILFTSLPLLL